MKAKDTVMTDGELEAEIRKDYKDFTIKEQTPEIEDVLCWTREAQAEISFKAGMEYGNKKAYEIGVSDGKVEGIAEGIREVVEWVLIQDEGQMARAELGWLISPDDWQAKLKEWGVE